MNAIIYPIHLRRDFEQRWAARMVRDQALRSPVEGTDSCICGQTVIAPSSSACGPNEVLCSACGRGRETTAPGDDRGY
jgi:hypothetical protein